MDWRVMFEETNQAYFIGGFVWNFV
jgi:hypothetical protein